MRGGGGGGGGGGAGGRGEASSFQGNDDHPSPAFRSHEFMVCTFLPASCRHQNCAIRVGGMAVRGSVGVKG